MSFLPENFKQPTPMQYDSENTNHLPEVLLLVVATAEDADVTYLLIKASDADAAVLEGNRASNNDLMSYEGMAAYFGVIRRSIRLNDTVVFTSCLDLINYCVDSDVFITTEQAIKTPKSWQAEFLA